MSSLVANSKSGAGKLLTAMFGLVAASFFFCAPASALQPDQILLIANQNSPESLELARYYQQQRRIPANNLLQVRVTTAEGVSQAEYRQQLLRPLQAELAKRRGEIRCLLLFYGIPLRVAAPEMDSEQWQATEALKFRKKEVDWRIQNKPGEKLTALLKTESEQLKNEIEELQRSEQRAAVDSEIALALKENYPLEKWLPNPFFVGFQNDNELLTLGKDEVLFVARLDGPNPKIVRRMIDESLQVERSGLQGRAYFDARWPLPKNQNLQGYALYDASLHKAAELTEKLSRFPVKLDQQEALFQAGEAPKAALYCGWYSLGKYVDAFDWQPGAVAYHIASSECTTLKNPGSQVWCKRLLEDGVAATIGPVAEPYVQGFPLPELFFGFLLDGYYTLVESYFLSTPFLSWQMVLIGDPLYRPLRNRL